MSRNTLGRLTLDENDLRSDFLVALGAVNDETIILEIHQTPGGEIDDIRVNGGRGLELSGADSPIEVKAGDRLRKVQGHVDIA